MKKSKSIVVLFAALSLTACEEEPDYTSTPSCDNGGSWDGDDCYDGRDSTDTDGNRYRHSYFGYWYMANRGAGTVTRLYNGGIGKTPYRETVRADVHRAGSHLSSPSHYSNGGKTSIGKSSGFGSTGSRSYGGSSGSGFSSSGG